MACQIFHLVNASLSDPATEPNRSAVLASTFMDLLPIVCWANYHFYWNARFKTMPSDFRMTDGNGKNKECYRDHIRSHSDTIYRDIVTVCFRQSDLGSAQVWRFFFSCNHIQLSLNRFNPWLRFGFLLLIHLNHLSMFGHLLLICWTHLIWFAPSFSLCMITLSSRNDREARLSTTAFSEDLWKPGFPCGSPIGFDEI